MSESEDGVRPNVARIYDYWLGGTDNFEVDRQAGQAIAAVRPGIAGHARENKQFLTRAVTWLAARGVRQFLDVGAGLPTSPARDGAAAPLRRATHEAARAVVPDAVVAYLDHDPVAVEHSRRVLAAADSAGVVTSGGVVATGGDMLEPEAILADPAVRAAGFDPARPAAVLLACVLHFVPEPVARDVVARFHRALAPGSCLVVSIGHGQGQAGQDFTRTYNSQNGPRIFSHTLDEFAAWFDGLEILPPGLVDVTAWRPRRPEDSRAGRETMIVGGVARKP